MTLRAILGLFALSFVVFGVGASVLWALGGWRTWNDLLRLAGVAYLLGVAVSFIVLTSEIVLGLPSGRGGLVVTALGVSAAAIATGWLRGARLPRARPDTAVVPRLSVIGAIFTAAILVYLEAVFRAGRLERLWEWDAWRVWTLVAKQIYFTDTVDPTLLTGDYPSYPIGFPAMQAAAFHAMGSADVVTIHLLQWTLIVGFVAAVVGLLAPRVRQEILLPSVLVLLVAPGITDRVVWMLADLPLDYLLAAAALLLVLWIDEKQTWHLLAATVLIAGALLTKREGLLLAACIVLAAFAASLSERRWAWPRLGAAAFVAVALALPWRAWIWTHSVSDAPQGGYTGFASEGGRAWPSTKLVVQTYLDFDLWLATPFLAAVAVVLALHARAWKPAVFAATFLGTSLVGAMWVMWANTGFTFSQEPGSSPVVRLVGGTIVVLAAITPLLLQRALPSRASAPSSTPVRPLLGSRAVGWALVLAVVVGYPILSAVG